MKNGIDETEREDQSHEGSIRLRVVARAPGSNDETDLGGGSSRSRQRRQRR